MMGRDSRCPQSTGLHNFTRDCVASTQDSKSLHCRCAAQACCFDDATLYPSLQALLHLQYCTSG